MDDYAGDEEDALELQRHRQWFASTLRKFLDHPGESLPPKRKVFRLATYWYLRAADNQLVKCIGHGLEQFASRDTPGVPDL